MDGDPRVLPLADAGGLAAPAAAGVSAEVSGEPEGVTLLDAVAAGRVPRPPDGPFHDWLRWRAREGMRPVRSRDGVSTTMQQEAVLWKALMAAYYGEERAEALEEEAVSGEGPRGLPSPTMSEASAAPGVEELQKILMETYDPTKETVDSFVARVDRAADSLQGLGLSLCHD